MMHTVVRTGMYEIYGPSVTCTGKRDSNSCRGKVSPRGTDYRYRQLAFLSSSEINAHVFEVFVKKQGPLTKSLLKTRKQ